MNYYFNIKNLLKIKKKMNVFLNNFSCIAVYTKKKLVVLYHTCFHKPTKLNNEMTSSSSSSS